ncbi:twin-arginine translocation pathway signal protein [Roseomonas alkaliterrae]|uniref:Tripartite-type tricarboxylate transporter receptor subunit TctC n=1 Tax=Neoroseomonas alkaliterrae TaxID=1452450 RepID=A0A840XVV8_9PROT|nr:tripartite tricarboxylate transporter substrate-binding protein [Neoroseomonas alkaliterrae]MBB5690769.1 tripartite-type tricarboxylate transporter receptor subunit TctC [Neoroseomonas alkaliterrae]MBR0677761.1 twin-arginine translocation pathway signal protein [Neoroseomonas alkaliterrae]
MNRRSLITAALAAPALASVARAQGAAWSPSRPIRLIAPYPPGGGVDTTSRLLAGPMGALLGQPVVVENRAGAGGSIGAAELARSAPDGHSIMVDAMAHTVNPHLIRNLPFDYATAFAPISQVVVLPQILAVNPQKVPAKTVQEFLAWARPRARELSYGSSGNATAAHLAAALFLNRAGLDITHVPYRGGTPALQDLLGGNIVFVFGTVSSTLQLVRDGRLVALGVSTAQRIAPLPEVPTIAEQGFEGFELNEWNGLYAPAGTPAPAVQRLFEAARHALADATVRQRLDALGALPLGTEPAAFARHVAEQRELMGRIVREARIEAG